MKRMRKTSEDNVPAAPSILAIPLNHVSLT